MSERCLRSSRRSVRVKPGLRWWRMNFDGNTHQGQSEHSTITAAARATTSQPSCASLVRQQRFSRHTHTHSTSQQAIAVPPCRLLLTDDGQTLPHNSRSHGNARRAKDGLAEVSTVISHQRAAATGQVSRVQTAWYIRRARRSAGRVDSLPVQAHTARTVKPPSAAGQTQP